MSSESTVNDRAEFVAEKFRAGWSKGAIKAATRKKFGPQANADLERLLREAMAALGVATETDAALARALDLYGRWTAIAILVNGQLFSRERLHRAMKIPPPAEMLRLKRDFGTNSPPPLEALAEIETLLADMKLFLSPHGASVTH